MPVCEFCYIVNLKTYFSTWICSASILLTFPRIATQALSEVPADLNCSNVIRSPPFTVVTAMMNLIWGTPRSLESWHSRRVRNNHAGQVVQIRQESLKFKKKEDCHAQQLRKENIHHMDFVELSGDSAILGWNVSVTKKVAD
jgi:hypothetical protein